MNSNNSKNNLIESQNFDLQLEVLNAYTNKLDFEQNKNNKKNIITAKNILKVLDKDFPNIFNVDMLEENIKKEIEKVFNIDFALLEGNEINIEDEINDLLVGYKKVKDKYDADTAIRKLKKDFPLLFNIENKEIIFKLAVYNDYSYPEFNINTIENILIA